MHLYTHRQLSLIILNYSDICDTRSNLYSKSKIRINARTFLLPKLSADNASSCNSFLMLPQSKPCTILVKACFHNVYKLQYKMFKIGDA